MFRFRVFVSGLVVCGIAGCSLLTDLDDLSGGQRPGDGGAEASAVVPSDDGGSLGDGGAGFDGAVDSGAQGCARFSDASFCVDFDRAGPLQTPPWTNVLINAKQDSVTLSPDAVSAPNGARMDLVQLPASGECAFLNLTKEFSGSFDALKARVAVRADEGDGYFFVVNANPNSDPNYKVLVSFFKPDASTFALRGYMQKRAGGVFSDVTTELEPLKSDPAGTYQEIEVEYPAGTPKIAIVRVGDVSVTLDAPDDFFIKDPRIEVGPYCVESSTQVTVDDVAVWLTP